MATVPTFVYLGDWQINGGEIGIGRAKSEGASGPTQQGLWGIYRQNSRFNRTIPWDPTTGVAPANPAHQPYWDGRVIAHSGTSTAVTQSAITQAGIGWTITDQWRGRKIKMTSGAANNETRDIASSDGDTVYTTTPFTGTVTAGDTFEIIGAWVVYHHTDSTDPDMGVLVYSAGARGDNWYEGGGGISPCTMFQQLLAELHAAAPYYKMFKLAADGGFASGASPWSTTAWSTFETEWQHAADTALYRYGDTLDVRCVILDAAMLDVKNVVSTSGGISSTFGTALQTTITNARTKFPNALILVVSPGPLAWSLTLPGVAIAVRETLKRVVIENDNCQVFDMAWADWGAPLATAPLLAFNYERYSTEAYLQAGVRLFNAYTAAITAAPTPEPGNGIATYILIGDSQMVGTVSPIQAIYAQTESILGPGPLYVRSGEWIYNGALQQVELYDVISNSNTLPATGSSSMGPDVSASKRVREEHAGGTVLFKFAKGGTSVTSEAVAAGAAGAYEKDAADLYDDVVEAWSLFKAACVRDLNRLPDVRGIAFLLGDNDSLSDAAAAVWKTKTLQMIADYRDVFSTRVGETLPVWFLQPPQHSTIGGQSLLGLATARETIREAIAELADEDRVLVRLADPKRYELKRSEGIHYGAEGVYNIGYDLADDLIAANDGTKHVTAVSGGTEEVVDPSDADATATALADSPDIASYKTPEGLEVTRRSIPDMLALERFQREKEARGRGIRRTHVRFD
ncbi:MAG: hypothetical protein KDE27_19085 [Planctomycetes bacterium]|nr:hypothetical protein [Planctomycetota bacterium]